MSINAIGWSRPRFFQPDEPVLFEIISTTPNEYFRYEFYVDGTVEAAEGRNPDISSLGEIGINDFIETRPDGILVVTGETGNLFGDAYHVTGEILLFSVTDESSGYELYLDGEQTDDPTGPVHEPEYPAIPVPAEDTCQGHIDAAQQHSTNVHNAGFSCQNISTELACPMDTSVVYTALDGCEVEALQSYGWTSPEPPDTPDFPPIPTPAEDTCPEHVNAAKQYQNDVLDAGFRCSGIETGLVCPHDPTFTYTSPTSCQTEALRSYGWTIDGTTDGGGDGGLSPTLINGGLLLLFGIAAAYYAG